MGEVVLLLREYLEGPSEDLEEDIRTSAYELALHSLQVGERRTILGAYRDSLREAVLRHVRLSPNNSLKLLSFFGLFTDALWRAYSDKLRRTIRLQHKEGLMQELRLAKRIQQRLLPRVVPLIPGYEVAGKLVPAAEVGGDYWSVREYPEDGVVTLKLADIAGHGIAAATLVAAVKFISGGYYRSAESPSWVIQKTNQVLVRETPADILVTMVYCWLMPRERRIRLVNAGHHPVIFYRDGQPTTEVAPTGPVLGLMEASFRETELDLRKGDMLVLCSDGVIEAKGSEPFGVDRLMGLLEDAAHLPAEEIVDQVIERVTAFAGQPTDDISVVVLKVTE
jgi:sigma-B regulation protein RsbU (phosphoserine phosphatase)